MIDGLPLPRRYVAIAAMSFGSALVIIDGSVANVALPTIARDLDIGQSAVVSVVTVYQVMLVMLMLPVARLGERIGLKRTYQSGQVIFTIATLLCFFARSLPFLLIVRAMQAVGAAGVLSVAAALIRSIYPRDQLGRGFAVNAVVVTSSAAAAPMLGSVVLSIAPWPWVFASALPFALLSLAFGRAIPEVKARHTTFDIPGAAMCAAMFGLIIGGIEFLLHGHSPAVAGAIILGGVLVGIRFVRHEKGEPAPILPLDLLARPVIALSAIAGFTAFVASMTLLISVPFRLQALGFSAATIGAALAPFPLTNVIVAPLAGFLSDRVPAGILGGIGAVVAIIALLLLAALPAHPSYFAIAWRVGLCGSGFGIFLPPNARFIVGSAPGDRAAAAGGLVATIRLAGETTGATVVAALLALGVGTGRVPPLVAAGLVLVGGLCSIARLRPGVRNPVELAPYEPATAAAGPG